MPGTELIEIERQQRLNGHKVELNRSTMLRNTENIM
jgi:hypothetical protein